VGESYSIDKVQAILCGTDRVYRDFVTFRLDTGLHWCVELRGLLLGGRVDLHGKAVEPLIECVDQVGELAELVLGRVEPIGELVELTGQSLDGLDTYERHVDSDRNPVD
jgi:hypothetical protein